MSRATIAFAATYLASAIFIFKELLTSPGSIGFLHDWNLPYLFSDMARPDEQ